MNTSSPAFQLRAMQVSDLDTLFEFQLDKEGAYLAAFMPEDPTDKEAYLSKFRKLLEDPTVNNQTILLRDQIVGSVSKFVMKGEAEITYWIDRSFWGKGIATSALQTFLSLESARPIYGRVAFDNFRSQKVLEKCGFKRVGADQGFANARQAEINEYIYRLD
ncbi:MAG: N-acetyltransferase [Chitinophagaceae bacterium]|nr:MAG: N-acetyltransferase [Chitinophagaceae bacterium]